MTDETNQDLDEGFSLADLADLDVSEIEEVRFITLPAGTYDFEVAKAEFAEDAKDGEKRFKVEFDYKILECRASIEPGVDRESLAGKVHSERFFIYPSKPQEDTAKTIGRIRAMIADMGCDNAGTLGDIVRNTTGHVFSGKIQKQKDRNDPTREYARLRLEPAKK